MNINKNISVWSGSETPPTKYHLWIKNDGQYIFDGEDWVLSPIRIQLYKDTVKISTTKTQDIYYTYKEDVFEIDSSTGEDIYNKELTTDVPCTLYWSFYCLNSEQTPLPSSFNYEVRFYWNINQQNQWEWSDWISNYTPSLINKGDFETHVISVTKEMLDISKQNDERKDIGITQYEIRKKNTDTPITQLGQRFHIVGRKYYNDLSILYDYIDNKFTESSEKIEQTYIKKTEKGVANGVAPLDNKGLIPNNHLPSYVDDVIEVYASFDKSSSGALENIQLYFDEQKTQSVVGEKGKIYIDLLTNYQFRWSGTIFTPISIPDSSIVDLGQFETETAADNVMLADNTGVIFNSQCLIITYKIGEQRAIIINQYSTSQILQYKYFNGEQFYRIILHDGTTVLTNHGWVSTGAQKLIYINEQRLLQLINRTNVKLGEVELPLVTSTTDGLMSKEDKGSLDDNTTKISSIFNGNPPLANILLDGTWTIYNQDNSEIQQQPPRNTNPTVEYGYKAKYSGQWKWVPVTNGKPPETTSGPWGSEVPKNDNNISSLFTSSDYLQGSQQGTTKHTYTQTISAPKLGLMVKGSDVVKAEGVNDSKSASTSITFKHKLYYGANTSDNPSADVIKALTSKLDDRNSNDIDGRYRLNITIEGVSTGKFERYYFAYPKSLRKLYKIEQNGINIKDAFILSEVSITNAAGLEIIMYVYKSNKLGAFTNQSLKFIWP